MNCSFLKAAAVAVGVAVLAATARAASFVPAAPLPSGLLLSSPPLLWIAANVIFIWLMSSYRHQRAADADSHVDDSVSAAMDSLYQLPSDHDLFPAVVAPDAVVTAVSKRQTREERTARRQADRPRVRKKSAGEKSPRAVAGLGRAADAMPEGKKSAGEDSRPRAVSGLAAEAVPEGKKSTGEDSRPRAVSGLATEAVPEGKKSAGAEGKPRAGPDEAPKPGGVDDVSMDSAWQSIVRSGAARPVAVRKAETWAGEELPRMQRAADKAVARREMRKSATMVPPSPPHPSASAPAAAKQGWRTREVLVMAGGGELLRRAESFIRRQHEYLRLQRQESEQRQAMEHERRRPAPVRV